MKKIVISCGPIPAKLDSVKIITNQFKGGLAFKTAEFLQNEFKQDKVTIVKWRGTPIPFNFNGDVVDISDVFEYYKWFENNATLHDVFILAGAVANLTPSHPYEGKFPSHNYKVGEKFNIEFEIAPRSIDIIKKLNPRSTLIGYKLYDAKTDAELIEIGKGLLKESKANIIFANTPKNAKDEKFALTQDGGTAKITFDEHLNMISQIINAEFFKSVTSDLDIPEDLTHYVNMVNIFEKTFEEFGTVAFKTDRGIITTSRGHTGEPVIVYNVDFEKRIVYSNKKATLNAPTLFNMLNNSEFDYVIHRHDFSPNLPTVRFEFPGTIQEVLAVGKQSVNIENHGYLILKKFSQVDWTQYYDDFPERYFADFSKLKNTDRSLEVGGNKRVSAKYALDPYVKAEDAINITYDDLEKMKFDFITCRNAINYLTEDEIKKLTKSLSSDGVFVANTFSSINENSTRDNEAVYYDGNVVNHYLIKDNDEIIHHQFYYYDGDFFKRLGFEVRFYNDGKSMMVKYCGKGENYDREFR
jgi:hypothetical protein